MTDPLKPSQALLIFSLMARRGASEQSKLIPRVTKLDREALVSAKLCTVTKLGRALHLALNDAGWAWAANHLNADLPPAQQTLADLLATFDGYLRRSGATIADIIGSAEVENPQSQKQPGQAKGRTKAPFKGSKRGTSKKRPTPRKPPSPPIRVRIEDAYLKLTGGRKNESVRLSKLRATLADVDRSLLDSALRDILKGDQTAFLLRHDDPRQLTPEDHDAAFSPFGEPFHVLRISS